MALVSWEIVYREQSGGQWKYWTYLDGQRVWISADEAFKMVRQGAQMHHC